MTDLNSIIQSNPCAKCRNAMRPKCICQPTMGGGSGGGSSGSASDSRSSLTATNHHAGAKRKLNLNLELDANTLAALQLFASENFSVDKLQNILTVDVDDNGSIRIQSKLGLSEDQQKNLDAYLQAVDAAFESFKSQLQSQGVAVNQLTKTYENNNHTLIIRIGNPALYDAFIQNLKNLNLLPADNNLNSLRSRSPFQQLATPNNFNNEEHNKTEQNNRLPNPFQTKLLPKGHKGNKYA